MMVPVTITSMDRIEQNRSTCSSVMRIIRVMMVVVVVVVMMGFFVEISMRVMGWRMVGK